MKVRDLLTDESKWTKHVYALDAKKNPLADPLNPNAVCWCLGGAIEKCYPILAERLAIYTRITQRVKPEEVGSYVHRWNDTVGRTFAEVRALVEELDI